MPGKADFREAPSLERLRAAMQALAEFHLAAASFPLPAISASGSPGIRKRLVKLQRWMPGGFGGLAQAFRPGFWPELDASVGRILRLSPLVAGTILSELRVAAHLGVSLQPCIRDVWHAHVLFAGSHVRGLIDFGSMQADNVATDVARLLGSMALDDPAHWREGLDAYRTVRPLEEHEVTLTKVFDRSGVLLSGLNWIDWIYRQNRVFDAQAVIPVRLAEIADRLERLSRRVV
jgi:Ser/Thr protein kinase RdoA (MazF antagonist)